MTLVNALGTPGAHENILGVIGHADHLVGHHLPRGEDQIESPVGEQPIHLGRPVVSDFPPGNLIEKIPGHHPQGG